MNPFITVTHLDSKGNKTGGIRLNIDHIIMYSAKGEGTFIGLSDDKSYPVAESPRQIDFMIDRVYRQNKGAENV